MQGRSLVTYTSYRRKLSLCSLHYLFLLRVVTKGITLFTVNFSDLHYNTFERGCEAVSGRNYKIARNCLTSIFNYITMQMRKVNCEKGY